MWLLLRSEATARRLGRWIGTAAHRIARRFRIEAPDTLAADLEDRAVHFRDRTGPHHPLPLAARHPGALAQQASLFFILLASVRAVGITHDQLDWVTVFAAFAFVQILTSIPITPAGLGVAEAAYVTLLAVGSTGGLVNEVAAAALIYRIFAWLIVIPFGAVSWVWWSRTSSDRKQPAGGMEGAAG